MAVLTVSELNRRAADIIGKNQKLRLLLIEGEIENLKIQEHLYFSLRDAQSTIRAVMFRQFAEQLRFEPENGMLVLAAASADIYEANGIFQLRVTDMLSQGMGGVHRGIAQRRERLSEEGILDAETKKEIPGNPQKIGVITSPDGAAVQDIFKILGRRAPSAQVILFPVHVQGKYAEAEICQALARADAQECDVLILGRGGGSAEDLQIFDSEKIARAVHSCKTPVISAVGHETDFTLTDEAADLRASTPSAAAELASQAQYPRILLQDNHEVLSVRQIQAGDLLKICLSDGCITVRAESEE